MMDTATLAECRSYSDRLEAGEEAWQRAFDNAKEALCSGQERSLPYDLAPERPIQTTDLLMGMDRKAVAVLLTAIRAACESNHYVAMNKLQELADMLAADYAADNWPRYE